MTGRDDIRLPASSIPVPPRARGAAATQDPFGLRRVGTPSNAFETTPAATKAVSAVPSRDDAAYFAIVSNGSRVDPAEVEVAVPAVEVSVAWGERDVLSVTHLAPPRPFVVGECVGDAVSPDFELEASFLGTSRWTLVEPHGGGVRVVVPRGATIRVRRESATIEHAELLGAGALAVSSSAAGGFDYVLAAGETAAITVRGFVFSVRAVNAGKPIAAPLRVDRRLVGYTSAVAAFVIGLFAIANSFVGDEGLLTSDSLDLSNRYVAAVIQTNEAAREREVSSLSAPASDSGSDASGDPGLSGEPDRPVSDGRRADAGDSRPEESGFSTSTSNAENNVVVDAVARIATLFASGSSSTFGANDAIGADALDTIGALIGTRVGSGGGFGGLSISGTGSGSGCRDGRDCDGSGGFGDEGTGYLRGARVDTHSNVGGECTGELCGVADRTAARVHVPVPTPPDPPGGGLTGAEIRRVVQRNISQVQHCYEQGLQANPELAGRVNVSFIVASTGAVSSSTATDSIGSPAVTSCITNAVRRWSFPQPANGMPVGVRFPFNLQRAGR